eukprot:gb/GFBE01011686.1/.p1 GENE.gb/GFBE01011686.1/~~gb/GFBE01011686.1/.p1  ORF type:complete len:504 (+),score=103.44 gb/GFBE01011686.1/:1-1512(+)
MSGYASTHGNTYEEVREVGRGGRGGESGPLGKLCGSLCCSMFGVMLYFGALFLVAHNETSTVCVQRALHSSRQLYEEVDCSGTALGDSSAPLYLSCPIADSSMPGRSPADFGANWLEGAFWEKAVKVRQEVSMLQCVEKKHTERKKEGDRTVEIDRWTYSMEWSSSMKDSGNFKAWSNNGARDALRAGCGHNFKGNPTSWNGLTSQTLAPERLMVGSFDLTRHLSQVSADTPVALKSGRYYAPSSSTGPERRIAKDGASYTWEEFQEYYGYERAEQEWNAGRPAGSGGSSEVSIRGNKVHTCNQEEIGCMRVSYYKSSATHASHIGKLSGRAAGQLKTRAWTAPSSWMCNGGGSSQVDLFSVGAVTANGLVEAAESSNMASTWALRIAGIVMAVVGIMMFLNPLQTLANLVDEFFNWFRFIPILGWLLDTLGDAVAGAVSCAIFGVALGIGMPSALLILSLSWCAMRPMLGVPMLAACLVAIGLSLKSLMKMAQNGKGKRKTA